MRRIKLIYLDIWLINRSLNNETSESEKNEEEEKLTFHPALLFESPLSLK